MSIVKQEDLDEQRGVKREHELDSNLTDELVHCIDKARLAQRYLGLGGSACTDILGKRLTPTKGEQDVVFVSFQCESMGRIEKPQAGERARIHNIEISFVGSAIHSNNSHKNEKWSWAKNVTSKRPTQKSRFQRSQAIENTMLNILNEASSDGKRKVVLVGHDLPHISACLSEVDFDPAVLPYVIGTLDTQDLQIAMNYYRMKEQYQLSDDYVMKRDRNCPANVLDKLLELATVSLKARGEDDDEKQINGGESHYLNKHSQDEVLTAEDQERLLQESKGINVSGRKSWW
ncbi:hypothetical protein BDV97DRAFT_388265 [Delphinella strobiligena]|nr:hypothetical protein BDV97DRAFT_388265 [Delphinella strobiligena]